MTKLVIKELQIPNAYRFFIVCFDKTYDKSDKKESRVSKTDINLIETL